MKLQQGSRVAIHHRPAILLAKGAADAERRLARRGTIQSVYDTDEINPVSNKPIQEAVVNWDVGAGTFERMVIPLVYLIDEMEADRDLGDDRANCRRIFCTEEGV